MTERPILFSAPMVRAILAGTKTQTRRVVKPRKDRDFGCALAPNELAGEANGGDYLNAYCAPGDRLWVREAFYCDNAFYPHGVDVNCMWREVDGKRVPIPVEEQRADMLARSMYYRADGDPEFECAEGRTPWRPSIHMPRWAGRITLEVTGVRVERLQDISEADAIAEGVGHGRGGYGLPDGSHFHASDPRESFRSLWAAINGAGSVEANPWVWAVSFKRLEVAR